MKLYQYFLRYCNFINDIKKTGDSVDVILCTSEHDNMQTLINEYQPVDIIYNNDEISSLVNDDYLLTYFKKMLTPKKYNLLSMFIKNKDSLLFDEKNNLIESNLFVDVPKNPDAQKIGTESATQFPSPSLVNPLGQT